MHTPPNDLLITRVFDAPRDLVYNAWTQPERLAKWWGPKGFGLNLLEFDLKPGGVFRYAMILPGGETWWGKFTFLEIVPPDRLVFTNGFTDESGTPIHHPMAPTWPLEIHNTMTLTEENGKTTLTLRGKPVNASVEELKTFVDMHDNVQKGFGLTFDVLEEYLAAVYRAS